MNLQQLLQRRRQSVWSGESPEEAQCHSGSAAGSDWSLHSAEVGLLELRASEIPRTEFGDQTGKLSKINKVCELLNALGTRV